MIKRSKTEISTGTATAIRVTFALALDETDQAVSVVGEFNDWDPFAHPLKKRSNGTRSIGVDLAPGTYRFKYLAADGTWLTDPDADAVGNDYAGVDSLLTV